MAKRMIEKWQIKRMWTLASKLKLTRDELYAVSNRDSLHDLTFDEASEVLARLSEFSKPKEKPVGMITSSQEKKIWSLMYELEKHDTEKMEAKIGKRLIGIIKKELKINATLSDPFRWIEFETANKLIEILKGYVKSAKKKEKKLE